MQAPVAEVSDISKTTEALKIKNLKNRPDDSKFTQQSLPVWKPILTLRWSIGVLVVGAIASLTLGILIIQRSNQMSVYRVAYDGPTPLTTQQDGGMIIHSEKCHLNSPGEANSFSGTKTCFVTIVLRREIAGETFVFYELNPFYQNHRRYMTSQVPLQYLNGWKPGDSITACDPVLMSPATQLCNGTQCFGANKSRQHFPCGLVANTMFNDIFWLHNGTLPDGRTLSPTDMSLTGVARVFASANLENPSFTLNLNDYLPIWHNPNYSRIIPPPGSVLPSIINSDYSNSTAWATTAAGTGVENEMFRVWVNLAAGQVLRKPYGRIIVRDLPAGTQLTFAIQSNFYTEGAYLLSNTPAHELVGVKAIVVGEIGWFGSENLPLGVALVVAASMCIMAAIVFLVKAIRNPRKLGDVSALKWKMH